MDSISKYIGTKIKYYRNKNNLTQEELGKKLGTGKGTISNYETGYRTPNQDVLFEIAEIFQISINNLFPPTNKSDISVIYNQLQSERQKKVYRFAERQLSEQDKEQFPKQKIYKLGISAAGPSLEYGDPFIEEERLRSIPNKADFTLDIKGDSMEPQIKDGSQVFVESTPDVENGEIAIVELNGDGVTCKKVKFDYDNKRIILQSLNPKYEDMVFNSDQIRIIGRVVK